MCWLSALRSTAKGTFQLTSTLSLSAHGFPRAADAALSTETMDLWTQFRRLLLVSDCSAEDDMATHSHALRRRVQIANISDRRPLRNGPHITAGPHVHFHIADEAEVHGEVYRPASGCCESQSTMMGRSLLIDGISS